jgi:hypothetical protein
MRLLIAGVFFPFHRLRRLVSSATIHSASAPDTKLFPDHRHVINKFYHFSPLCLSAFSFLVFLCVSLLQDFWLTRRLGQKKQNGLDWDRGGTTPFRIRTREETISHLFDYISHLSFSHLQWLQQDKHSHQDWMRSLWPPSAPPPRNLSRNRPSSS